MWNRAVLFVFILLMISCTHRQNESQPVSVFRYNESKGISTLDPAFARNQTIIWPVNQLYNGLVQLDSRMRITPCIAKRWEISSDGKEYTFYLRNDVFFHDHETFSGGKGRKVTASDVYFSVQRILDPHTASPGRWIFNALDLQEYNDYSGCKVVNDTTFKMYLTYPFPPFMGILTMPYCFIVPEEVVVFYGKDFGRHPVGTGPFQFKIWKERERLIFVKNENYFEKDSAGERIPYLDAVNIFFIPDKQSEFLEFIKGNLDFISGIHSSYKDELITRDGKLHPKYREAIRMYSQPYLNTEYLGILVDETLFDDTENPLLIKEVRQAINYGFDRGKMMRYLRNNIGSPAVNGIIPNGLPMPDPPVKGFMYDPDKSRALLAKAGFPEGNGLPEITLSTTSDYADICEYLQHELSEIGIKINIDLNSGITYRTRMVNAQLSFFRASWIADYPDAENYLALFYSRNLSPVGPNYTHFARDEYDRLYEQALAEKNDSLRLELYKKMDQLIIEEAVVVPLYYDQVVRFTKPYAEGLQSNAMNILNLKYVKKEEK